jgi:hypothetical protein
MSLQPATSLAAPLARHAAAAGHRAWRFHAALLLIAALVDLNMLVNWYGVNHGFYDSDWLMFYQAAERLRDGGQPYVVVGEFRNPPPFLLLARGALLLGYIPSRILWCLASAAMLLGAGELMARALGGLPDTRERLLGAAYILLYAPTILLIPTAGNSTAPVVLGYALAFWLFVRGREGWGGAALCLTVLVKPQLAFLTLPLLLYKKRWRAAAAYLATAGAALALSLVATGWHTFVNFYQMDRTTASMADSVTLWIRDIPGLHAAFLQAFPGSRAAGLLAYALSAALIAMLAWYWRGPWRPGSSGFASGWAMIPIVDLLTAPYSHSDDLVLLIVPAVVLYVLWLHQDGMPLQWQRYLMPALLGLYLAPVLVVYLRQHFMIPAMLAALVVLRQSPPGRGRPLPQVATPAPRPRRRRTYPHPAPRACPVPPARDRPSALASGRRHRPRPVPGQPRRAALHGGVGRTPPPTGPCRQARSPAYPWRRDRG